MNSRGNKFFKLLDRYVGIPILLILKLFSRRKEMPSQIKSIGILTVPAIGDIVLLNGFLRDIKNFNQNIKIILFVSEDLREIAEIMGSYDELLLINLNNPLSTIKILRSRPVDVFIDASQWARLNAILAFFSRSKYRIGFKTKGQCKHLIFDFAAEHSNVIHELYNYKKLAFPGEIKLNSFPQVDFTDTIKVKSGQIVIHTMPSGYLSDLKRWPETHWKKVIDYLLEVQCEIYFTGSTLDYGCIESLLKNYANNENLHNVAGKYSLKEIVILLKSSQVVLSVNTGIMHLASVLNCNLIALHGPTNPNRWGPLNRNAKIIQGDYPEAPCLNLGFEYNCKDMSGECMKRINPEKVISEIKSFGL